MKFSVQLVALVAGLAAGNPTLLSSRQNAAADGALKKYCNAGGFEPEEIKENEVKLRGTCAKGSNAPGSPSFESALEFCKTVGRVFAGAAGPYQDKPYAIFCGAKEEQGGNAANEEALTLLNQIIAETNGDSGKLEKRLAALSKEVPSKAIMVFQALRGAPKLSAPPGGIPNTVSAPTVAVVLLGIINANINQGGLLGPETEAGKWLRINPIYGKAGTQPSPFDTSSPVTEPQLMPQTQKCIPFKDESRWYWITSVTRCKYWHDRQQCDTSYAYDAATDKGKALEKECDQETNPNPTPAKTPAEIEAGKATEKEAKLKEEEEKCFKPRMTCSNVKGKFLFCMDEGEADEKCKSNQWWPGEGRTPPNEDF